MLEIATTRSMTNSMNVPDCSSTPIGWMRMKVHAMPKNRSSMMNRIRPERILIVFAAFIEKLPAFADDGEVDDQRAERSTRPSSRRWSKGRKEARW